MGNAFFKKKNAKSAGLEIKIGHYDESLKLNEFQLFDYKQLT